MRVLTVCSGCDQRLLMAQRLLLSFRPMSFLSLSLLYVMLLLLSLSARWCTRKHHHLLSSIIGSPGFSCASCLSPPPRLLIKTKRKNANAPYNSRAHSAVQYAGFTCMPFVGGFLAFLMKDSRIPILGNFLVLTSFTAPVSTIASSESRPVILFEGELCVCLQGVAMVGRYPSERAASIQYRQHCRRNKTHGGMNMTRT